MKLHTFTSLEGSEQFPEGLSHSKLKSKGGMSSCMLETPLSL